LKKKIIALSLLLLVGGVVALYLGGFIFSGEVIAEEGSEEAVELDSHGAPISKSESLYLPLNPPFVVNFTHLGALRYLQISVEVMYPEQEMLDEITANMPAVRNALILLLSNQEYQKLSSQSGKEEIRGEMIAAINDLILPPTIAEDAEDAEGTEGADHSKPSTSIGAIFFTNYVMQ
jgi:flagellar FliL protein